MPIVDGVDLAVIDAGSGPAFVWGHGFASGAAQESTGLLDWTRLARGHRVVRWDAPGHGDSEGTGDPDRYRWDRLGRDLLALTEGLGIGRFVAGGVSMGAATALHAAVQEPERVAGLVLALPPTAYETRAAQADEYRSDAELVEREGVDAYVESVGAEPFPEMLREIMAGYRFVPTVPAEWLPAALRGAAASDLPPPELVRAVTAPTLLLAWDGDPGHPLATAERLADLIPGAELDVASKLHDVLSWTDRVAEFLDLTGAAGATPAR